MLFWLAVGGLALAAVAFLLLPLLRPPSSPASRADYDIEIYRDQLGELERDRARGLLGAAEAEAARREIGRKLLAADAGREDGPRPMPRRTAAALAAVFVPALALALYLELGSPGIPDQPLAARQLPAGDQEAAALEARVAELGRRLQAAPEDAVGWTELGGALLALGREERAVEAYRRAMAASGGRPEVASLLGEALVRAASGIVTEESRRAFDQAIAGRPDDARARYYLALADYQAGRFQPALEGWRALAVESPADTPWRGTVEARIRDAAKALDRDGEALVAEARAAAPRAAALPGADDLAAARQMSPEERAAMIESMVKRLAARMAESPDDLEGWLRLGRAYSVLEERDKAIDAFARAAAQAPENLEVLVDYAHALMKTVPQGGALPERLVDVMREIEALDPRQPDALWFLGVADAQAGRKEAAAARWRRLLTLMPPDSQAHTLVARELAELEAQPTPP